MDCYPGSSIAVVAIKPWSQGKTTPNNHEAEKRASNRGVLAGGDGQWDGRYSPSFSLAIELEVSQ